MFLREERMKCGNFGPDILEVAYCRRKRGKKRFFVCLFVKALKSVRGLNWCFF